MANKDNIVKSKPVSERVLRQIWRNRRRFPQSKAQVREIFKDKQGQEYLRWTNGMVTKKV